MFPVARVWEPHEYSGKSELLVMITEAWLVNREASICGNHTAVVVLTLLQNSFEAEPAQLVT